MKRGIAAVNSDGPLFSLRDKRNSAFHADNNPTGETQEQTNKGQEPGARCEFFSSNYSFSIILIEEWFETRIDIALLCFQQHIDAELPARLPVPAGKLIPYQIP